MARRAPRRYHAAMQTPAHRWTTAWQTLGLTPPDGLLEALRARYAEPHRHYHATEHLDACLRHFDTLQPLAQHPGEIALALWFHDAIYDIGVPGNEARSADWAQASLLQAGAAPEVAQRVHALVMATCHDVPPRTGDQEILLDVDLAILGAPPAVFARYEAQIRTEFADVPEDAFRQRRWRILQQFLDRPRIYHTELFHAAREAQARTNLERAVQHWKSAPTP
jgi:predicted metal-dependent HD superfamily phosphohydrolase